jgi:AmmeMemoRadiSam system protein A
MLPLTEYDRWILLRLAREALSGFLNDSHAPRLEGPAEALCQPCGAFVTLRKGKNLRGCIGVIESSKPLYQVVRECVVAAAVQDPRFSPVTKDELPELKLEISALSPLFDISPENIEVGQHGLVISHGRMRGLLLPQVAAEWKWDSRRFLEETCRKAGLPADAWQHGARVQAFTAQVFEEGHAAHTSYPAA